MRRSTNGTLTPPSRPPRPCVAPLRPKSWASRAVLGPLLADPSIAPSSLDMGCGVNLRDGIAEGEATTALQFTTVMAGCRLFYVLGDVLNASYT